MSRTLRIATRHSPLALWQAEHVQQALLQMGGHEIVLHKFKTQGDRIIDQPLAKIGGKGLFVKELERALFDNESDLAVHSMKDMAAQLPEGLCLAAILPRESPYDAWVSERYASLDELPAGAVVGTSSLRRQCQILALYPHLDIKFLRGNINTRLAKLDAGDYDGIVLACAGLERLGFHDRIRQRLDTLLPAIGQGAIGVECRSDDTELLAVLRSLHCPRTAACVEAERAINAALNGSCQTPIGGFAQLDAEQLHLRGLVGSADGQVILHAEARGHLHDAQRIGDDVARQLLELGAAELLAH